jgi:hypothetical protein
MTILPADCSPVLHTSGEFLRRHSFSSIFSPTILPDTLESIILDHTRHSNRRLDRRSRKKSFSNNQITRQFSMTLETSRSHSVILILDSLTRLHRCYLKRATVKHTPNIPAQPTTSHFQAPLVVARDYPHLPSLRETTITSLGDASLLQPHLAMSAGLVEGGPLRNKLHPSSWCAIPFSQVAPLYYMQEIEAWCLLGLFFSIRIVLLVIRTYVKPETKLMYRHSCTFFTFLAVVIAVFLTGRGGLEDGLDGLP